MAVFLARTTRYFGMLGAIVCTGVMSNGVTLYNSRKFGFNQVLITITYGMHSPATFSPLGLQPLML